jgi:type II secretory pathway component PulF
MIFGAAAADDHAAVQCDDLASALDAGLPLPSLGGDPRAGDQVVASILQRRGVRLAPFEVAALAAGWKAGRAPVLLRSTAERRRQRAALRRQVWSSLRYPVMLLVLTTMASAIVGPILGAKWLPLMFAGGVAALAAVVAFGYRALRRGGPAVQRLPFVGELIVCAAEVPYLEALHALYASGVPIAAAHTSATAAVPTADLAARLQIAARTLAAGQRLHEALDGALALHTETRQLLATGEHTGQLEDALQRALRRRREQMVRHTEALARWFGIAMYAFAALGVMAYVTFIYNTILTKALGGGR